MISPNVITKQLGFPLHGVSLCGADHFIAGGGGGDGRHDIPKQVVGFKPHTLAPVGQPTGEPDIDFKLDLPRRVVENQKEDYRMEQALTLTLTIGETG